MTNTYSTKPFISYDGEDEHGVRAEVKVVTGYGLVSNVEASKAGRSFKVSFSVENTQYDPAGWAPDGSNVLDKIRKAEEREEPIHFRIETRRQKDIDRSLPISELTSLANAKDSIHKSLSAVKFEGDDEWTISPHAVTSMDEDPVRGDGIYRASDMSQEKRASSKATSTPIYSGIEPPPYVTHLKDGSLNPGSAAVAVPLNVLAFLTEWDREHPDSAIGDKKRLAVCKMLISAANELQVSIFDGKLEAPDLGAGSHTRARALLFELLKNDYSPSEERLHGRESLVEWKKELVEKAEGMWRWSMEYVESVQNNT